MKQINWYDWTFKVILSACAAVFAAMLLFGCNNAGNSEPEYKDSIVKALYRHGTVSKDSVVEINNTVPKDDTIKVKVK